MYYHVPLTGVKPISTRRPYCAYPKKPHALAVHKRAAGMPSSSAASSVKGMAASATMQVTGGTPEELVSLSLVRSSLNGPMQNLSVESHREGISWVASTASDGLLGGIYGVRWLEAI
ncbi:hypothetical protein Ancab_036407 [Ancistrocladus abbreviatus]